MKTITVQGITAAWNEKIYKNNTIYLNNQAIKLTNEEIETLQGKKNEAQIIKSDIDNALEALGKIEIKGYKKIEGTGAEIEGIYNALSLLGLTVKNLKDKFYYNDYRG